MKAIFTFIIFILFQSAVAADEKYTNNIYTSITLLYWCIYKEVPKNKNDISKVTNIDEPSNEITIGFNQWLSSMSYEIKGNVMIIKKENKTSTSNCKSVEIIRK